jgi:hypothetical protein
VLYTYDDWGEWRRTCAVSHLREQSNSLSEYVEHIYRQIPDLVKAIFADEEDGNTRFLPHMKSGKNPHGIPAWKVRSM